MWVEMEPKEGDTVKVAFREERPQIGVVEYFFDGYIVIDFGSCKRYIERFSTIYVKKN